MSSVINPHDTVVPIFAIDSSNDIQHFLGSGGFLNDPPVLITAYHVVSDWNGRLAIANLYDLDHLWLAKILSYNKATDLAVLEVPGYTPRSFLQLSSDNYMGTNNSVMCIEYGTTRKVGKTIQLGPATRVGNICRFLDLRDQYGEGGEDMLELSFPALKGASGAPVMTNPIIQELGYQLLGIIVANAEYQPLPAQIISVLDEENSIYEEIKYMLPQALAVNAKHLKPLLSQLHS
jgi:hypothetical protein